MAFANCNKLTQIKIGNGVTQIGGYAFYADENLKNVSYKGSKEDWESINIASNNDELLNADIVFNNSTVFVPVDITTYFASELKDNILTVNIIAENKETKAVSGVYLVAIYSEDGRMKNINMQNVSSTAEKSTSSSVVINNYSYENGDYVTLMLTNDLFNMIPLTQSKVQNI